MLLVKYRFCAEIIIWQPLFTDLSIRKDTIMIEILLYFYEKTIILPNDRD